MNETVHNFFAEHLNQSTDTEVQAALLSFEDLWEAKLWHELTGELLKFFNDPRSAPLRLPIYKSFILKFADRINQLKLVDLALKAASQCQDLQERLSFTEAVAKRVDGEDSQDALVYAITAVAQVKLELGQPDEARKDLDRAERVLDRFDSVETIVHAAFYDANAQHYRTQQDYASYYRNALLYLACIDVKALAEGERRARAHELAIAALVSTSIYNFGELLLHPVLEALRGAEHAWLRDLLFAFNRGDLAAYDALAPRVAADPVLGRHAPQLRQKMCLAALTEAVFRRPPHDRAMSFAAVARETGVRPDEIEHLVMRALSLGLLRGTIDQVDGVARVDWVQPKVLDLKQIDSMRLRLADWDSSVNQLGNWIEKTGQDVWAA